MRSSRRPLLVRLVAVPAVVVAVLGMYGQALVHGQTLQTPAERSGYEATPSQEETISFLRTLSGRLPEMRVETFGSSGQGREMTVVILASNRAFTPEAAHLSGRPVVLVQCGVHAGEIDGKDAALAILRDLAQGRGRDLLDGATILIVPIYNVDGHEQVSVFNRPNQDGPHAGMGFRTTTAGYDLNRDFVKAQSPEARALLGLVKKWQPDLHIDIHVTDGVDHHWVLTWSRAEAPQLPAPIEAWLAPHLQAALATTERAGFRCGPYVELKDRLDPAKGFDSSSAPPGRYSTGYFPLRNRASILIEMHSYKPYGTRVKATAAFLSAMIREVSRDGRALCAAVAAAEQRTVSLGRPDADPSLAVLEWEEDPTPEEVIFPIYAWTVVISAVTGGPLLTYQRGIVREISVPWFHRARARRVTSRPRGYLLQAGWPQLEELLLIHGLKATPLRRAVELEVERIEVTQPVYAPFPYQGLTRVTTNVSRTAARKAFRPGDMWIPADQPAFELAVQVLEPEAPDSALSWGLLSTLLEQKEYIDLRNLEPWVSNQLRDATVAAEWSAALTDPMLAKDPRARMLWWYRRTPYWQAQAIGVMPIYRVTSASVARAAVEATEHGASADTAHLLR